MHIGSILCDEKLLWKHLILQLNTAAPTRFLEIVSIIMIILQILTIRSNIITIITMNIMITRIVEIVSIAIAEFTQAEFLGQQDPQVKGRRKVEKCFA